MNEQQRKNQNTQEMLDLLHQQRQLQNGMLTLLLRYSETTDKGIVAYGIWDEDVTPESGQLINVMGNCSEIRRVEKDFCPTERCRGQFVGLLLGHEITLHGGPLDGQTEPATSILNPEWPLAIPTMCRADNGALYFGWHVYVRKNNRFTFDRTERGQKYDNISGLTPISNTTDPRRG